MRCRINALSILMVLLVLSAIMSYSSIWGIRSAAAERYIIEYKHGVIDNEGYLLRPQPPLLYPIDNPDGNGDYLVDWSVVPSASSYRLEEDDNASFNSPFVRYQGADSQYHVTGQYFGTWYYRVLANNSGGNSVWSNTETVDVNLAPPPSPLLDPITNPDGDGDYLVEWNDVPGADIYRLEEAKTSDFISPTVRYEGTLSQYEIIGQQPGTWYYRVQADNEFGSGPWSNVVVVGAIPAAPLLLSIDNADGNGEYLTDWSDVTGASIYRLEEAATTDFISPTVRYEGADSQYSIIGQSFGTWYYRVRAGNIGGDSPWSNPQSVIVTQAPPVNPTLDPISNPDGNGDYLLDWNDVPSATSYRLEEADNQDFISSTVRYSGVYSYFQVTSQPAGTWFYRVLAVNGFGNGPWSNIEHVNVIPTAPALSPIDNIDGNGDYLTDWSDVPGASSYRLEEANNSGFISSTMRYEGVASQFAIVSQPAGKWYYRVLARNVGGNSPWSNVEWAGVISAVPLLSHIDNTDGNGDYLVDWNDVGGATSYRLEEAATSGFISPTLIYTGTLSAYPVTGQPSGAWYYRVLASNAAGNSAWSNTESVAVIPGTPTLLPIDNGDGDGAYLLDWSEVPLALSYRLEQADNLEFISPSVRYEGPLSQFEVLNQQVGTWYYRVLASNTGGDSLWSNPETVTVYQPPPASPTLDSISNPDGDGNYLVNWSDVTGAISYRLEEAATSDFITPMVRYIGGASQYQVTGQQVGTWYYRVLASNVGGDSPWSNTESVIVDQGPQESPILYAINNADGNGDYLADWSDVTGATSYRLEEDDNIGFISPVVRYEGVESRYQVISQQAGTWYYRVLAKNKFGSSPWSNIQAVSVIPKAPVLSPIDNPDNNGHYLIDWGDVLGATSYRLEEDDNAGFPSPTIRYEGSTSQYQIASQPAGTWYYRVLARNAGGNSPWSNTVSVNVAPTSTTRKTFLPSVYSEKLYPYGIQVLPASFNYTSHETLYIIGEVLNNTRDNISSVKVIVNFYDADNHLVGTKFDYLWPLSLTAYDKGCFNFDLDIPPGWSYYKIEISGYKISGTSKGLTVFDHNGSYNPLNGNYEIIGQVRNEGNQRSTNVTVSGTLYNTAGVPVGCEHRRLNNATLNPGQTSSFGLNFLGYYRDYKDVIAYKLRVAGDLP